MAGTPAYDLLPLLSAVDTLAVNDRDDPCHSTLCKKYYLRLCHNNCTAKYVMQHAMARIEEVPQPPDTSKKQIC